MNKKHLSIIFVLATLFLAMLACSGSVSTANIKDARMTLDKEGTQETTVFSPKDVFHCVGTLANAPDDTTIKASWIAVEAEGIDPNYLIMEKEVTGGSGSFNFELSNDQLWPAGKYKVDLYLNDKLETSVEFEVQP